MYAHSLPGRPVEDWEPLARHLAEVGERAAEFAAAFGWAEAARAAGLLHDIGKASAAFFTYISRPPELSGLSRGPDHSTAGAREALALYSGPLGRMLAFAIAGHHAGLADAEDLDRRLDFNRYRVEPYTGWQSACGPLPVASELRPSRTLEQNPARGFSTAFLARMLFSCLVDADFLATESFYATANGETVARGGHASINELRDRLHRYMARRRDLSTPINRLRAEVLDHAVSCAARPPGLFTLTVPTGGGKTLTSLSFALEHAVRHDLKRVIYVIPFTSIIEQTADVFRAALGTDDDVLEHHASFDWESAERTIADSRSADDEGPSGLMKLRRAAENWDVPIVVTTAVQFFESLYAYRPSRCRKLHNIARSVIVLDEAQTLPVRLLRPCLAALDELARNYGASIVLCTATQPALRRQDEFKGGLDIPGDRELAPDPDRLYAALKRVSVEWRADPVPDVELAARFAEVRQMLCIVNSRHHAYRLFNCIKGLPGAVHLSTLMCPRHRRAVLAELRQRLTEGAPVRLVATSLIEAGVDIDFPEVWRAAAGIDSIAQAAGRCNREAKLESGCVVVFEPVEDRPPHDLKIFWQAACVALRRGMDPLSREAVREYFRELYWSKGDLALDAARLEGERFPILADIAERAKDLRLRFASMARAFRMIEDATVPVVVPWATDDDDRDAASLLARISASKVPRARDLRRLQLYTVPIALRTRDEWLKRGVLKAIHPALANALLAFEDLSHYDRATGLRTTDIFHREADSNIW